MSVKRTLNIIPRMARVKSNSEHLWTGEPQTRARTCAVSEMRRPAPHSTGGNHAEKIDTYEKSIVAQPDKSILHPMPTATRARVRRSFFLV